jgi:hypothetical protein
VVIGAPPEAPAGGRRPRQALQALKELVESSFGE